MILKIKNTSDHYNHMNQLIQKKKKKKTDDKRLSKRTLTFSVPIQKKFTISNKNREEFKVKGTIFYYAQIF